MSTGGAARVRPTKSVRDNRAPRSVATGIVILGLVTLIVVLQLAGGAPVPAPPRGLPDPGRLTGWGLPMVRFGADLAGLVTLGAAMVPLLTMHRLGDSISQAGSAGARAVFAIRRLALLWAVLVLAELVLTYSDQFAVPVTAVRWADLRGFAQQGDQGKALVAQLVLVTLLAGLSRWLVTVGEAAWLLVLATAALVPPLLTGHSAASGSHDTAIVSLVVHVLAVGLWSGGVVALWWHLAGDEPNRSRAGRRFSSLAAWCFGITALSGVVNALVRLGGLDALVTSDYGRVVLAKVLVLVLLGMVAARSRAAVVHRYASVEDPGSAARRLLTLTGVELGLMAVAVGIGVGLSRTPPPAGEVYTNVAEGLLGGPVPAAPTVGRLLWSWTPSGVGLVVLGFGIAGYLAGVVVLRRRGVRWSVARSVSWMAGLALVGYATLGGLGTYSHVMFSAHMAAHMVLSMVAPILLVLGAPVTLALRALPGGDLPGGQGPRQWLAGALRSRPARLLTHPVPVTILFVGSLYAIYFTGWFDSLMRAHLGHGFMEAHFLLVGFLFFEVLIGNAPIPNRLPHLGRLLLLLVVMPFHAFFAVILMGSTRIVGADYYSLLDRGFATDLQADQYLGGSLAWALGEVPMVLVLFVLLAQWHHADSRQARRLDDRANRDGDQQLESYNQMLGRLAERDRTP